MVPPVARMRTEASSSGLLAPASWVPGRSFDEPGFVGGALSCAAIPAPVSSKPSAHINPRAVFFELFMADLSFRGGRHASSRVQVAALPLRDGADDDVLEALADAGVLVVIQVRQRHPRRPLRPLEAAAVEQHHA